MHILCIFIQTTTCSPDGFLCHFPYVIMVYFEKYVSELKLKTRHMFIILVLVSRQHLNNIPLRGCGSCKKTWDSYQRPHLCEYLRESHSAALLYLCNGSRRCVGDGQQYMDTVAAVWTEVVEHLYQDTASAMQSSPTQKDNNIIIIIIFRNEAASTQQKKLWLSSWVAMRKVMVSGSTCCRTWSPRTRLWQGCEC